MEKTIKIQVWGRSELWLPTGEKPIGRLKKQHWNDVLTAFVFNHTEGYKWLSVSYDGIEGHLFQNQLDEYFELI